jgi:hypothetical protein
MLMHQPITVKTAVCPEHSRERRDLIDGFGWIQVGELGTFMTWESSQRGKPGRKVGSDSCRDHHRRITIAALKK